MADALLKYETLDAQDIKAIMAGERPNVELAHKDSKENKDSIGITTKPKESGTPLPVTTSATPVPAVPVPA